MNRLNFFTSGFIILVLAFVACTKPPETIPGDPATTAPSNLTERVIMDTAYGAETNQKMDIYLPAKRNKSTKVIVLIHGGGWTSGSKGDMGTFVNLFRTKWPEAAIVNLNYRYANGTTVICKDILADIKAAIHLVAHNKTLFAVSDTFALFGASAGAHLALQYSYTQNAGGEVKCVADLYGPTFLNDWTWYNNFLFTDMFKKVNGQSWNEDVYKSNSPYTTATSGSPATIIFHGSWDPVVPLYQSQWFYGHIKNDLKMNAEFYTYDFNLHGFTDENNADCVTKSIIFFKKYMN